MTIATIATDFAQVRGNRLRYTLHPGQAKVWRSEARFTFVIAGTQSGKTSFVPLWLNREIKNCGHGDYLAATSTYDLFKLKLLPEMRHYFVDTFGWSEDKSDRVFWQAYKPRMFDRIILRSASSEGGLESATIKAAVLDECGQDDFRVTAWEAVQRRLSLAQGRVLGTTTPYNLGWLKQEIYDPWRNGDKDIRVIQFPSIANPVFPRVEYDRAKAKLPAWKFEMFYNGNFTRPPSLIYGDYIDDYRENGGNLVHPFDLPPQWPRYIGIDFGAVNTATIHIAEDPAAKVYYIYRETLEGEMTTAEHCSRLKSATEGVNLTKCIGGSKSETQQRMDWRYEGVWVDEPHISDVEAGIDRVISMFKDKTLYVFDNLKGLRDELGTYGRVMDDYGQSTDKIKDKETFHRLDGLRYIVSGFSSLLPADMIDFA